MTNFRSSHEIEREFAELKNKDTGTMDVRTQQAYLEAIQKAKQSEIRQEQQEQQNRVNSILEKK